MSGILRLRLFLDFVAVGLVIACLAYWWLDNLWHELFGTALFLLVIAHNVFNRRWYGTAGRKRHGFVRLFNVATIACLAVGMLIILITSLLISRDAFAFLALDDSFAIREIHMFAAYWVLLAIAIHLGMRWAVVMHVFRAAFGIEGHSPVRTVALRLAAAAIFFWGARSIVEMGFGSKLMLTYALDMWDFNDATLAFFVNYGSIVGLFATATHYGLMAIERRRQGNGRSGSSAPAPFRR